MAISDSSSGQQRNAADPKHACRRVVNPRAAVIVCCTVVIVTLGVRKLHGRQFDKTVQFVRRSAMAAVERQDYPKAVMLLNQYLSMRRSDMEAMETMSQLLDQHVGDPPALERAFHINEDLLRDSTPLPDLRLRQARLAVRLRRYSDAEAHLKILQPALPDSAEVWMLSAQVALAMRHTDEADRLLRTAIRCPNPDPAAYAALVDVSIRRNADQEDVQLSRSLLDEMIQKHPTAAAYTVRAVWHMTHGDVPATLQDVWKGLQQDPGHARLNDLLVHCCQSVVADQLDLHQETLAAAIKHFEHRLAHANDVQARLQLATILWLNGSKQKTLDLLEDGIRQSPRAFAQHRLLAEYLLNAGQPERAREILARLPRQALTPSEKSYLQGRLLMAEQNWTDAVDALNQSIAFANSDSETLPRARIALAISQRHTGQNAATLDLYQSVLTSNPNSVDSRLGIAAALVASKDFDQAIGEYEQLVEVPGVAAYLVSLMIQHHLQRPESLRRWDEVQKALELYTPVIDDEVQITLLQADLDLARGRVADVLQQLESAARQHPDRDELSHAIARLRGDLSSDVADRLMHILRTDSTNAQVHAAILRVCLADADPDRSPQWLDGVLQGRTFADLDGLQAQQVMLRALQLTRRWELAAGRTTRLSWLNEQLLSLSREIVTSLSAHGSSGSPSSAITTSGALAAARLQRVRLLTELGYPSEALQDIDGLAKASVDQAAMACLEFVRFSSDRTLSLQPALARLQSYIVQTPSNMALRTAYAEMLLYADHVDLASQVLSQITAHDPDQGLALARLSWIQCVTPQQETIFRDRWMATQTHEPHELTDPAGLADPAGPAGRSSLSSGHPTGHGPVDDAMSLVQSARTEIDRAILLQPHDPLIQAIAFRVRLAEENFVVLAAECQRADRHQPLSTAALLCWATALQGQQKTDQARKLCDRIQQQLPDDPLLPADDRLLQSLLRSLQQSLPDPATAAR